MGIVYVGSNDGHVYAIDAGGGEELWRFRPDAAARTRPAIAAGALYVGSDDGVVYALNAVSGEELWRFNTGHPVESAPTVAQGIVYIAPSTRALLYALDAGSGEELWQREFDDRSRYLMLAPDDGVVYFDSLRDDRVYALDAASGEELWRFEEGSANSAPSVSKGDDYTLVTPQGFTGSVRAWTPPAGSRLKLYTGDPHSYFYAQTVADGVVYASNNDGYLYALPAVTPALAQETGAQPADETVSASATPELLWHYRPEGVATTPATVSNGVVYFGAAVIEDKELKDSFLYALDAAGGELLWRVRPGPAGSFFGISNMTHTTTGGVLYYLAGDGVRALDGDSGALLWDDVSAEASMEIMVLCVGRGRRPALCPLCHRRHGCAGCAGRGRRHAPVALLFRVGHSRLCTGGLRREGVH